MRLRLNIVLCLLTITGFTLAGCKKDASSCDLPDASATKPDGKAGSSGNKDAATNQDSGGKGGGGSGGAIADAGKKPSGDAGSGGQKPKPDSGAIGDEDASTMGTMATMPSNVPAKELETAMAAGELG